MKNTLYAALTALLICAAPSAQAQTTTVAPGDARLTPTHWAHAALEQVQQQVPDAEQATLIRSGSMRRAVTRTEMAGAIAEQWRRTEPILQKGQPLDRRYRGQMVRLVGTFKPELARMGMDVARVQTDLRAAPVSGPFTDVPVDHWAYESVERVRKAGIVTGYPGGRFNPQEGKRQVVTKAAAKQSKP